MVSGVIRYSCFTNRRHRRKILMKGRRILCRFNKDRKYVFLIVFIWYNELYWKWNAMMLVVSKTTIWQLSISRDGMLKNLLKNLMNLIFQISVMPTLRSVWWSTNNAETRFELGWGGGWGFKAVWKISQKSSILVRDNAPITKTGNMIKVVVV